MIAFLLLGLVLAGHAWVAGPSDDEAYYWVLSHHPGWGFAYHPPAVGWWIAVTRWIGELVSAPTLGLRLGSLIAWAVCIELGRRWIHETNRKRAPNLLLLFPGLTALAWLMVPDWPMLLGITGAFYFGWRWLRKGEPLALLLVGAETTLALASKLTGGVILIACALVAVLEHSSPKRRRVALLLSAAVGTLVGLVPTLIWNLQHDWFALAYQFSNRHAGASLSFLRWGRFALSQTLITGGGLLLALPTLLKRRKDPATRYALLWALAGSPFLLQPLWSDFKPHWAVVVWWPLFLEFCRQAGQPKLSAALQASVWTQRAVGGFVIALTLVATEVPIATLSGLGLRADVSSDLRGWATFARWKRDQDTNHTPLAGLPVVGSRYQTASQAAFALQDVRSVTLIPHSASENDDWPDIGATQGTGPDWPALTKPVLFVANSRYDQGPAFKDASCEKIKRLEEFWNGTTVQWIDVWRCAPSPRPHAAKS